MSNKITGSQAPLPGKFSFCGLPEGERVIMSAFFSYEDIYGNIIYRDTKIET